MSKLKYMFKMKNSKLLIITVLVCLFSSCIRNPETEKEEMKQYLLARKYYSENNQDAAVRILSVLTEDNPDFHQAAYLYGKSLFYSGKEKEGVRIWENLLMDFPSYIDPVKELVRYYIRTGDLKRAEEWVEKGLTWSSEDPTLIFLLSRVRKEQGEYEETLILLTQAESYMERMAEIPLEQAMLYQQYGFYKKSVFSINKAISLLNKDNPTLPALMALKEQLKNEQ